MAYSAFFTSGLTMASQPRGESFESFTEATRSSSASFTPHIAVQPSTPRPRLRRRRSSLTIATSPMSAIKSPSRSATEAARTAILSPTHSGRLSLEGFPMTARPKFARRKTVSSVQDLPTFPAPTAPLPPLPSLLATLSRHPSPTLTPGTLADEICLSSPVAVDPVLPSSPFGTLRNNPARRSSSVLPPQVGGLARGPFTSSLVGNVEKSASSDMQMLSEEEKDIMEIVPSTEKEDSDSMKEN